MHGALAKEEIRAPPELRKYPERPRWFDDEGIASSFPAARAAERAAASAEGAAAAAAEISDAAAAASKLAVRARVRFDDEQEQNSSNSREDEDRGPAKNNSTPQE